MTHRAELPQALVDAGLAILAESGAEGLTLRRIAARAGVSHAAPAHYFDGLAGLKMAIAIRGFESFLHALLTAQDSHGDDADPFQVLLAVNLAYIRFAAANVALFRLMFDQLPTVDPELRAVATQCHKVLDSICAPFANGQSGAAVQTSVWALTHGYAALGMGTPYPASAPIQFVSFEHALRLLVG